MKNALFIDRDGVINKMIFIDGQFDSPQNPRQVSLVEGIIDLITWLNKKGVPVVEVTNQPGAALGKMKLATLKKIEKKIHKLLNNKGAHIDHIYSCLHHLEAKLAKLKIWCACRKPKAGLLLQAGLELNINLKKSVILGDNATDMKAGKKVGTRTILFFHTNDTPEKVIAKQNYPSDFRVYSHQETLLILKKLFK